MHKVDPNETASKSASAHFMKYILDTLKVKKIEKNKKIIFSTKDIVKFNNIRNLIESKDFEGFNLILSPANAASLAYCLVALSENFCLQKTILQTSFSYGIYCANSMVEALDMMVNYRKESTALTFSSYACSAIPGDSLENNTLAQELLKKIKIIDGEITRKVVALEKVEFEKQYQQLFNYGEVARLEKKWNNSYFSFIGCEFLLMKRAFGLYTSQKEVKTFIKGYSQVLYDNIIMSIPKMFSSTLQVESMVAAYRQSQTHFFQYSLDKNLENKNEQQEIIKKFQAVVFDQEKIIPFCEAARDGKLEILQMLLNDKSISLDTTAKSWTPLHFACAKGQLECAKTLILSGAKINIQNNKGKKALELLKDQTQVEVLERIYFGMP